MAVPLVRDALGRPRLGAQHRRFDVNWSHSGDGLLVALGEGLQVGADLERVRPRPRALALARRYFVPSEADWLAGLPTRSASSVSCACGAPRKPCSRRMGAGWRSAWTSCCSPKHDGALELAGCDRLLGEPEQWSLREFVPEPGYRAAIAWRERPMRARMSATIDGRRAHANSTPAWPRLELAPALAAPLLAYLALLDRWNRTYNLTAIRDPREMVARHLLDSLAMHAVRAAPARWPTSAPAPGLPGIPLAIANRALQVTLVESNGKKARFLREARAHAGAATTRAWPNRASKRSTSRPRYDAITARALATLPLILELGGHLLEPGGRLLAMKGARAGRRDRRAAGGLAVRTLHPLTVPGLAAERHLVVVAPTRSPLIARARARRAVPRAA